MVLERLCLTLFCDVLGENRPLCDMVIAEVTEQVGVIVVFIFIVIVHKYRLYLFSLQDHGRHPRLLDSNVFRPTILYAERGGFPVCCTFSDIVSKC